MLQIDENRKVLIDEVGSLFLTERNIAEELKRRGMFSRISLSLTECSQLEEMLKRKCPPETEIEKKFSFYFRAYPLCMTLLLCSYPDAERDILDVCGDILGCRIRLKQLTILEPLMGKILDAHSKVPEEDYRHFLLRVHVQERSESREGAEPFAEGSVADSLAGKFTADVKHKTIMKAIPSIPKTNEWKRLSRRICREFKKVKYICDIRLNDAEYEMVKDYLKNTLKGLAHTTEISHEEIFAAAVAHTAARCYKNGNLWGNLWDTLGIKGNSALQTAIGENFYEILVKHQKHYVGEGKHFQNILFHCFVSDHYADAFFDFLYKFYYLDLDRDILRLDAVMMNELMESICREENTGRSYMLVQHISQAMAANRRGAKIRIRNILKLLDRFFWDEQYSIETTHRIYNLLQNWVKASEEVRDDARACITGRKKGVKRFSHPYLHFDERRENLQLILPSQSVRTDAAEVFWRISGGYDVCFEAEMTESVIGYKVLETSVDIELGNCLDAFKAELITAQNEKIKSFSIPKADVRFFDDDGDPISSQTLKADSITAISREGGRIESSGLYDSYIKDGCLISFLQLEFEDIIKLPDGKAIIVGQKEIQTGITAKGSIVNAICRFEEQVYSLYNSIPYLIIRLAEEKINGTQITVNQKRYHISDFEAVEFQIDDLSNDKGVYLNLASRILDVDDIYTVSLDIPGGIRREWKFVYIKDFDADFEDAPYVFEPRGTVKFPPHIQIRKMEGSCEKAADSDAYQFEIAAVGQLLDMTVCAAEKEIEIALPIPAVYLDLSGEDCWSAERPSAVWHSDLPDILRISVPYHKITLYMENALSEEDEIREVEYRRNTGAHYIECDISRFRSYLRGEGNSRTLYMRFGDTDEELLKIMIRGILVTGTILGDFSENQIVVQTNILGKGRYYADIRKGETSIAEKIPLDESGHVKVPFEIDNGKYEVTIYEGEDDDSGFGEIEYHLLGTFSQRLLNPYDMTERAFQIMQIEKQGLPGSVLPIGYFYYVENLQKTDTQNVYKGRMIVEKSAGQSLAALDVLVNFSDIENPNYPWISFVDEYGDEMDFLYDTKRKGILQEENPNLKKLACYRRYTFLDPQEYVFHVNFIEREAREKQGLPEKIEFAESVHGVSFTSAKKTAAVRTVFISDISWKREAFAILNANGFRTLQQIAEYTREEFSHKTMADDDTLNQIEHVLHCFRLAFRK